MILLLFLLYLVMFIFVYDYAPMWVAILWPIFAVCLLIKACIGAANEIFSWIFWRYRRSKMYKYIDDWSQR